MHIFLAIFLLIGGIVIIEHIEITNTITILAFAAIVIWSFVTFHLPAKKEDNVNQRSG